MGGVWMDSVSITTLPKDDRPKRMIVYTVSMTIRIICIGLCFVVPLWALPFTIGGAIILPWLAVVNANTKKTLRSNIENPGSSKPFYLTK